MTEEGTEARGISPGKRKRRDPQPRLLIRSRLLSRNADKSLNKDSELARGGILAGSIGKEGQDDGAFELAWEDRRDFNSKSFIWLKRAVGMRGKGHRGRMREGLTQASAVGKVSP